MNLDRLRQLLQTSESETDFIDLFSTYDSGMPDTTSKLLYLAEEFPDICQKVAKEIHAHTLNKDTNPTADIKFIKALKTNREISDVLSDRKLEPAVLLHMLNFREIVKDLNK